MLCGTRLWFPNMVRKSLFGVGNESHSRGALFQKEGVTLGLKGGKGKKFDFKLMIG